eukprot:Lithocolla_globosa_v1_NODE_3374_length_1687_cov_103.261029.p2 type:complete len:118 gc:universal NODE_3374_length_1687_cov_103.261029:1457-1104(-)
MSQITKQQFNAFCIINKLPFDISEVILKMIQEELKKRCSKGILYCRVYNFRESMDIDDFSYIGSPPVYTMFNTTGYGECLGLCSSRNRKIIKRSDCVDFEQYILTSIAKINDYYKSS